MENSLEDYFRRTNFREVRKSWNLRHLLSRIWRKNSFRDHKLLRFWGFKNFRESGRLGKKKFERNVQWIQQSFLFHSTNTVKSLCYKANFNSKLHQVMIESVSFFIWRNPFFVIFVLAFVKVGKIWAKFLLLCPIKEIARFFSKRWWRAGKKVWRIMNIFCEALRAILLWNLYIS